MVLSATVGALDTGTGAIGTTVVVSGLGFQPKVIFFWWSGHTGSADAAGRLDHKRGFGAAISTTDRRFVTDQSDDTPTAAATDRRQGNTACVGFLTIAGAGAGLLDVQSIDSGGFTLVVDEVCASSFRVHYLALGGADISNVIGGDLTHPDGTAPFDQQVTGLGFQPDLLIFFSNGQQTNTGSVSTDSRHMIGAAKSASSQYVFMGTSNDAATTSQTIGYCRAGDCIALPNSGATAIENRAQLKSMDAGGFTITWVTSVNTTPQIINYVAIKGGGFVLGDLLTQTDTTTDIVESGFGFSPRSALFVSHCKAQSTAGTVQDDDEWSCGAFDSTTSRGAQGVVGSDAAPTMVVSAAVEHDAVYANMLDTSGALEGLMDVKSVDSDGFTCIMDDADPAQAFVWYVAFGDTPAAPTGQPYVKRGEYVPGMNTIRPGRIGV